ncbi:MAG: GntR family transcriptional regulator [Alphaproteobacteria bacterium]
MDEATTTLGKIGQSATKMSTAKRRTALPERAYVEIKRRILENEMPAGFQALELELAEALNMSRTPVREALIRLANEGLVVVRPRQGMRVLPVSAEDIREIYEIVTPLEAQAAEIAARRGLTAKQLVALEDTLYEMDRMLVADDLIGWANADQRFHRLLVEFCGNSRLLHIVGTCWDQIHRVRMISLRLRPKPMNSNIDHRTVVDAISKGDWKRARDVHREHRERSAKLLVGIIKNLGLPQL